jgi:hypothetical protein
MPRSQRTSAATVEDARSRLRSAEAYLEVAELVLDDRDRIEMPGVAAPLAVLAGIAASDTICATRLPVIHRGDDHRAASALLESATPDGKALATTFLRLIDVKDQAHYGVVVVPAARARNTMRWARQLTDRARQELER